MHPDILPLHAAIEAEHWWFVARREIVRKLLARVEPPRREARVLDLGCGTGGTIGEFGREYHGVGVERDPDAVRFASDAHRHCRFVCASLYEPDAWELDGPLDVCLIMDVLEHLDEDRTAVENAVTVLRPGGHLLITVPANPALWSRHDRHHEHRRRYTAESLDRVLDGLGLRRRLLSYFNSRLYPVIRISRWLQNKIAWLGERGTTGDLRMPSRPVNALLRWIFGGEGRRLEAALADPAEGFRRGVSLIAIYQKERDT